MRSEGQIQEGPSRHGRRRNRWLRRLAWLIVSGCVVAGLADWSLRRPVVDRWIIGRLDRYARQASGLEVRADGLEIAWFQGRIRLRNLAVGGDLLRARLLEVELDWTSLLDSPHLRTVRLVDPVLNLDRARLGQIRLQPRPAGAPALQVRLDRLEVSGGEAHVREPAWGLPAGDFRFQAEAVGESANHLRVDLRVPGFALGQGPDAPRGDFTAVADVDEGHLDLDHAGLRLDGSEADFRGRFLFGPQTLSLTGKGSLDLARAQRLVRPGRAAAVSGNLAFQAQADGPLDHLVWTVAVHGRQMQAKGLPLQPGTLEATAGGDPGGIRVDRFSWTSLDGTLEAAGGWGATGAQFRFKADALALSRMPGCSRIARFKDLTASLSGAATLAPGAAWADPRRMTFQGAGEVLQDGRKVGGLELDLEGGQFQARSADLLLPGLELHGSAAGTLAGSGLAGVEGEASLELEAGEASALLKAWGIGAREADGTLADMDLGGHAKAQGRFSWGPREGARAGGRLEVQRPRWRRIQADRLSCGFELGREDLRLAGIQVDQDAGRFGGELWLTWADLPRGSDAFLLDGHLDQLSMREALEGADAGDLPVDGALSGRVRVHGPFDHLRIEGQALAGPCGLYGLRLPAVSADFDLDPAAGRYRAGEVRIADSPEHLTTSDDTPGGPLDLRGSLDLDSHAGTWHVAAKGALDSGMLGLQGPRVQAWVEAALDGPITAPLGPIRLPVGTLALTQGQISLGGARLEGIEGAATFSGGKLSAWLGLAERPAHLLKLEAAQAGPGRAAGTAELDIGPATADTPELAAQLTQGLLQDARLRFRAQGAWGPGGLAWQGRMDRFSGQFEGFHLDQSSPASFSGDAAGMRVAMGLEARLPLPRDERPPAPETEADAAPVPEAASGARALPHNVGIQLQGRVPFSSGAPLDLDLRGSEHLDHLKTLLDRVMRPSPYSLMADLQPEGRARFDLHVGGTPSAPYLDGTLTLEGGAAVVRGYSLNAGGLEGTVRFQGQEAFIPQDSPLRGTLAQGAFSAWGRAAWRAGGLADYDLSASLHDFQLRDLPEGLEVQGSLDARLKGNDRDGGRLSGDIRVTRSLYRSRIDLSSLILAQGGAQVAAGLNPSTPLARIDLDLALHMAEPWEMDTNILKLQGRLSQPFLIGGTLDQPGLKGRMELLSGGMLTDLFPAGDVVLERGSIEFRDPAAFDPMVDVLGQIDVTPYRVTLALTGTLATLQARPTSTPSLTQEQIFAILIDPSQAATVGSTGSSSTAMGNGLAGTGTGLLTSLALANFQERLRKALALDRVSVSLRAGTGAPERTVKFGTSFELMGYRVPLVFTHDNNGEVTTISGQTEWRFGDFLLSLGASQSSADSLAPSGEIRHTWSPP